MPDESWFWQNDSTGDATLAPYSSDEHNAIIYKMFGGGWPNRFVIKGYLNELAVTNTSGSTFSVATGAALLGGTYYRNTAPVEITLGADGWYWIALQKVWATKTIRAVALGPNGGSPPSLVYTPGTKWEVALLKINKSGGVIVSTEDQRAFIRPGTYGLNARHHLFGSGIPGYAAYVTGVNPQGPMMPLRSILGVTNWTGAAASSGSVTHTFPVYPSSPDTIAFHGPPVVIATSKSNSGRINVVVSPTPTSITFYWYSHVPTTYTSVDIMWMAIGRLPIGHISTL